MAAVSQDPPVPRPKWSPARQAAFEVSLDVLRDFGVFTDIDDDGHARLTDSSDHPDFHPDFSLRVEPHVAAEALARVEQAAEPLRREIAGETYSVAARDRQRQPAQAAPRLRPQRRRERRATRRTSRTTPAGAGDDGPAPPPPPAHGAGHRWAVAA